MSTHVRSSTHAMTSEDFCTDSVNTVYHVYSVLSLFFQALTGYLKYSPCYSMGTQNRFHMEKPTLCWRRSLSPQ